MNPIRGEVIAHSADRDTIYDAITVHRHNLIVTVRLLIGTGASYTMLSNRFIQSIAGESIEPLRSESILTANGSITAPVIPVPWINCLGNRTEQFPIVACALPNNAFIDGLLGMDFLTRCAAVINVRQAEVYVS